MQGSKTPHTRSMMHLVWFLAGGGVYVALELFWRGRSHVSMFLAGGTALMLFAGVAGRFPALPFAVLCAFGAVLITAVEFLTGAIVNGKLGLAVWDYSKLPMNLYGQVCLRYSALWFLLSAPALACIQLVNGI